MSAVVDAPAAPRTRGRLTFGGILASERIKFTSLASTLWCLAAIVVGTVGIAMLASLALSSGDGAPAGAGMMAALTSVSLTQLIALVLGSLVITREYGTGMIRSTFTAAPRRLSVLAAKTIVFGVAVFVVSLIALLAAIAATTPFFSGSSAVVDFADAETWRVLIGGAGYLAMIGLIGLGLGALIRNSAGAIGAGVVLVLVLPIIMQLIDLDWVRSVADFLPGSAGSVLAQPTMPAPPPGVEAPFMLEPWQALLVMLGWIAVFMVPAALLLRRRDA